MPKKPGQKLNVFQKRNRALKEVKAEMKTAVLDTAYQEYENLKRAVIYANDRINQLKRQRVYLAIAVASLLTVAGVDTYLLWGTYGL
jgi:hypothetical protein